MTEHIKILGILHIVWSLWSLAMTGFIFFAIALALVLEWAVGATEGPELAIIAAIFLVLGGFMVLMAGPGVVGGIALLKRCAWTPIFLIVASVLSVFSFPHGTALTVYTFIGVLDDDVRRELAGA
jgi:hypothetical protein